MSGLLQHDSFEPYYAGREKADDIRLAAVHLRHSRRMALRPRIMESTHVVEQESGETDKPKIAKRQTDQPTLPGQIRHQRIQHHHAGRRGAQARVAHRLDEPFLLKDCQPPVGQGAM